MAAKRRIEAIATIRVVLADDHPMLREGIRSRLERESDISVVGEADDGAEALRLVEELAPDVLLLDMEMPGLTGVETARRLQAQNSPVYVLVLSAYDDWYYVQALLSSGAAGYLTKEEAADNIVEAVRGVAQGETGWFSPRVAAQMPGRRQDAASGRLSLTDPEMNVLRLLADGETDGEISISLGMSIETIHEHLDDIYTKLGVTSRIEAAVHAVREGLV
jgi:DNA-binding NarL/FixJ family response regulator